MQRIRNRIWNISSPAGETLGVPFTAAIKTTIRIFFRSNTESILRHRPDNVYIARICGSYAGIAILDSRVREEPATGHISLLYMEAPFRGSGYGTQLIAYAEAVCRGRGCRQMRLYVSKSNRRARRFYEKNGYRRFGAQFYPFSGQLVLRKPL